MNRLLVILLLLAPVCARGNTAFEGVWKITSVEIPGGALGTPRSAELPAQLEIREGKGHLLALYTTRGGVTLRCTTAGEIRGNQNEIVFGCSAPFERNRRPRPPNLHVLLLDGHALKGRTIGDRPHYTWVAERHRNIPPGSRASDRTKRPPGGTYG